LEADRIREALASTDWNRGRAAALLGMDRTTLWRRMRRLGMLEHDRRSR
jgi:transcriptional regulator of acetoin/glycerol metabolism